MKKLYIHPEVQVTDIQTTIVMQAASPVGDTMGVFGDPVDIQW